MKNSVEAFWFVSVGLSSELLCCSGEKFNYLQLVHDLLSNMQLVSFRISKKSILFGKNKKKHKNWIFLESNMKQEFSIQPKKHLLSKPFNTWSKQITWNIHFSLFFLNMSRISINFTKFDCFFQILISSWFFGFLTQEDSDDIQRKLKQNEFFVRFSTYPPDFTLVHKLGTLTIERTSPEGYRIKDKHEVSAKTMKGKNPFKLAVKHLIRWQTWLKR